MSSDVLIISSIDYNVSERLFTADSVSKQCVRRQSVAYENKEYFYFDFLNKISDEINNGFRFKFMDIPSAGGKELYEYLIKHKINAQYFTNLDNQIEEIQEMINKGAKCVVFKLGSFFNALPIIRGVKVIRKMNKDVKIIVSSLYLYNKFATDSAENYVALEKLIGADYYVKDISDYESIYRYIKKSVPENNNVTVEDDTIETGELVYCNTSIGCMAKCSFCNFPIRNKEYHCLAMDDLKKRLDKVEKSGKKYVCFYDDTFNLPIDHFKDVCNLIIDQGYTFEWFAYCRLKELSEERIELLKRANCKGVFVGIESANDDLLKNMNKGVTCKVISNKLEMLKKNDILIFAFFLVGFPGETEETINNTIKFIQNSNIDFFTANLWYADVSTPIYKKATEFGLIGKDFIWKHNSMNSEEASQYANRIMNEVTEVSWVPNENFGFQAIAYLFSCGFRLKDIKKILENMKNLITANAFCDDSKKSQSVHNLEHILGKIKSI